MQHASHDCLLPPTLILVRSSYIIFKVRFLWLRTIIHNVARLINNKNYTSVTNFSAGYCWSSKWRVVGDLSMHFRLSLKVISINSFICIIFLFFGLAISFFRAFLCSHRVSKVSPVERFSPVSAAMSEVLNSGADLDGDAVAFLFRRMFLNRCLIACSHDAFNSKIIIR